MFVFKITNYDIRFYEQYFTDGSDQLTYLRVKPYFDEYQKNSVVSQSIGVNSAITKMPPIPMMPPIHLMPPIYVMQPIYMMPRRQIINKNVQIKLKKKYVIAVSKSENIETTTNFY